MNSRVPNVALTQLAASAVVATYFAGTEGQRIRVAGAWGAQYVGVESVVVREFTKISREF